MSPPVVISILASIGAIVLAAIAVLFEWNYRKIKKENRHRFRLRNYLQIKVRNCDSCPCYKNECIPVCNLDYTLIYEKNCKYIVKDVHPQCPLKYKHYILTHKKSEPKDCPQRSSS